MKRFLALLLALVLILTGCGAEHSENTTAVSSSGEEALEVLSPVSDAVPAKELPGQTDKEDLIILYTNDIHCVTEGPVNFDTVKALKEAFEERGNAVFLVDCGDHMSAKDESTQKSGEEMVALMSAAGYDLATFGNHEFDNGAEALLSLTEQAAYAYICCNFTDKDGNLPVSPYEIREANGKKIAFLGITTPETITKPRGRSFKDENGNLLWSFCEEDGEVLYEQVQKTVDEARAGGADLVIALSHLGETEHAWPFRSTDLIENVSGIDVYLDGHTHSVIEEEHYEDADGSDVILTQTGAYFTQIGCLILHTDGSMSVRFAV